MTYRPNLPFSTSIASSWRAIARHALARVTPRGATDGAFDHAERRVWEGQVPLVQRRSALVLGAAVALVLAVPAFAKEAPKDKDDDDDDKKGDDKAGKDKDKDKDKGKAGKAENGKGTNPPGQDATAVGKDGDAAKGAAKAAKKSDDDDDDGDDDQTLAEKAADRFPQPVVVGSLLRRTVLQPEESQPVLGHVANIVRAKDGTLNAVVNYGGFFGFNTRPIAVPIDAMALLGNYMEILDFTPAQLKGFPTFDGAGTTPVPHSETIRVALVKPAH